MTLLSPEGLETALRDLGAKRYHRLHPFHRLLHSGGCTKGQVQAWALNRYYYQARIPNKDASLIARCDDPALRRVWRERLVSIDDLEASLGTLRFDAALKAADQTDTELGQELIEGTAVSRER